MQIHETAFVVSTYRSFHEDISKDVYAKLWNNAATDALIPEILDSVSEHEAILHSVRNRFFYEKMQSFFDTKNGGTLINFGSGFSMYQFSLPESVNTIEIDKKDIIQYKKEKIDNWTTQGKLPKREIEYLAVDFNRRSAEEIVNAIRPLVKKTPTFILIEGVFFFLDRTTTDKLFQVFNLLQKPQDEVGCVTYLPEVENTSVYKRLLHYFDSHNDANDPFSHQTIPYFYFQDLEGYTISEATDEFELSKKYDANSRINNATEVLNETLFLLKRT